MSARPGPWDPWDERPPASPAPPLPSETAEGGPEAAAQFPCPGCGATLEYVPGARRLVCGFCGTEAELPEAEAADRRAAIAEQDYLAALGGAETAAPEETTLVSRCENCGAHVEFDPDEHAATCPFCASPIVAEAAPDRHIRPQALLPFAIGRAEARDAVRAWLAGRWFAPNGLRRYARRRPLTGVYTPWWTFDARTESAYAGRRGDVYVVRVGSGKTARTETRVRWRPARGRVRRAFDDVLALGATSLPEAARDGLGLWDLGNLEPYRRDWLAGFRAEAYTIPLREAHGAARREMEAVIRADVRRAIGGDRQIIERLDTQVWDVTFKHVLLPVWIGAYRWRGESYRIVVNGRTGRVWGERPWSWLKIGIAALLALLALAVGLWIAEGGVDLEAIGLPDGARFD